jgi:hypothetical protein
MGFNSGLKGLKPWLREGVCEKLEMHENKSRLKIVGINTVFHSTEKSIYYWRMCYKFVFRMYLFFVCEEVRWESTEHPPNQVPEHHSRGGTLTYYEACICQEFSVLLSPTVQLNLFHRIVSKCAPPACRQTSDFLTVILDPQRSCILKYWHFLFKYFL